MEPTMVNSWIIESFESWKWWSGCHCEKKASWKSIFWVQGKEGGFTLTFNSQSVGKRWIPTLKLGYVGKCQGGIITLVSATEWRVLNGLLLSVRQEGSPRQNDQNRGRSAFPQWASKFLGQLKLMWDIVWCCCARYLLILCYSIFYMVFTVLF